MKLKEKFEQVLIENFSDDWENECVEIADEFAIGFFNWATTYKANDRNNWNLTTIELLTIYKKEKGL